MKAAVKWGGDMNGGSHCENCYQKGLCSFIKLTKM